MNRDFTLSKYRQLIETIINRNYTTKTVYDHLTSPSSKCIILRHDVDREIKRAVEMAKIEYEYDIASTYYFRHTKDVFKPEIIADIADIIYKAYRKNIQVIIMGNGGSASTASHFARDLRIGSAAKGKPRVRVTSITDNMAMITSLANDIDYGSIFKEQLVGQLDEGDVVIGISASGNSPNVLEAVKYAHENGAITIALTGFDGGKLKGLVDKAIIVASRDYGQVEDAHLCLAHIISYLVREKMANV